MAGGGGRARPVWRGRCCHSRVPHATGKPHGTGDRHVLTLLRDGVLSCVVSPAAKQPCPKQRLPAALLVYGLRQSSGFAPSERGPSADENFPLLAKADGGSLLSRCKASAVPSDTLSPLRPRAEQACFPAHPFLAARPKPRWPPHALPLGQPSCAGRADSTRRGGESERGLAPPAGTLPQGTLQGEAQPPPSCPMAKVRSP